jgi:ABC-2 type transport system ATP-binding protein
MGQPIIRVEGLWKSYDGHLAVRGVSFMVHEGEVHGLLGPNGSGKTTTIKCLVGLLKPNRGALEIGGHNILTDHRYKRLIGYLPENPSLPEYLTVREFLIFCGRLRELSGQRLESKISELVERFELGKLNNKLIVELSKGTRQRVAIAAALIAEPCVLILDEPFSGLDPEAQHTAKDYMKAVAEKGGAVLMSTHILDTAEKLCDSATIIKDGVTLYTGPLNGLRTDRKSSLEDVFIALVGGRGVGASA